LYDPHVSSAPREWVRAWRPPVPGVQEVFHARFVDHAYPPHTHDAWTVFIVDEGAVRYDLERRQRGVAGARVAVLPPHVVHDGRAAGAAGYRKRVLYLGTDVLDEALIGPAVDRPDVEDGDLIRSIAALHGTLQDPRETLQAESVLAVVAERLARLLGRRVSTVVDRSEDEVAEEFRSLLDEHHLRSITLAEAGRALHVSPGHLVRSFTRAFGIAPHRYVIARRIDAARTRLLDGEPVAQVATGVGFYDQAHLTRHFRRHVGTTPARFARTASP
jgi:AraC-like DNA-binding protein